MLQKSRPSRLGTQLFRKRKKKQNGNREGGIGSGSNKKLRVFAQPAKQPFISNIRVKSKKKK